MEKNTISPKWRLYDSGSNLFFNNLNLAQLLKIIDGVPKNEIQYWHVCRDSDVEWFPLEQRLMEVRRIASLGGEDRPSEIMTLRAYVDHQMMETKSAIDVKSINEKIEKRKIKRLAKKVQVFIDVGDQILSAETKDISMVSIKLSKKFSNIYRDKYYPITLKGRPSITLRCKPLVGEKETTRGTWSIVILDPNFNLGALGDFLNS